MNIEKLTKYEERELEENLRQANSTIANLIRSFLVVIDETEESPARKERLKTIFLFAVGGILESRITPRLVRRLEVVVKNLLKEKKSRRIHRGSFGVSNPSTGQKEITQYGAIQYKCQRRSNSPLFIPSWANTPPARVALCNPPPSSSLYSNP